MRIVLPLLIALIAAGLIWFAFQSESQAPPDIDAAEDGQPEAGTGGGLLTGQGDGPDAAGSAPGYKGPKLPGLDPRTAPRGSLTVLPVDEDDNVIPIDRVKVTVVADGRRWPSQPVGFRNPETNAWEFKKLFVGPVKIICWGDTYLETITKAKVTVRPQDTIRAVVKSGGGIHWDVRYDNGAIPEKVKLELFRAGRPAIAWFEERHELGMSSRLRTHTADLGYRGYITGLKRGSYTLRATNQDGYYREADVEIVPGQVVPVELKVRDVAGIEPPKQPEQPKSPTPPPRDPSEQERNPGR